MRIHVEDTRSLVLPAVDTSALSPCGSGGGASKLTETVVRVRNIFLSCLELEVDADTDVIESGVLDSIAFVQLLVELEQEFEIAVDMSSLDLDDFRSVRSIARYVEFTRAEG